MSTPAHLQCNHKTKIIFIQIGERWIFFWGGGGGGGDDTLMSSQTLSELVVVLDRPSLDMINVDNLNSFGHCEDYIL